MMIWRRPKQCFGDSANIIVVITAARMQLQRRVH